MKELLIMVLRILRISSNGITPQPGGRLMI